MSTTMPQLVNSAGTPNPALEALQTYKQRDLTKGEKACNSSALIEKLTKKTTVVVRFKAVGNAPIMKQNFFKITASNRFQAVVQFLRKELGWKPSDPLVRYF
jgi:ubiquitin-like protein ATG12